MCYVSVTENNKSSELYHTVLSLIEIVPSLPNWFVPRSLMHTLVWGISNGYRLYHSIKINADT